MDWNAIKAEYITDAKSSYRKLVEKYGVSLATLYSRAKTEKWAQSKKQYHDKIMTKTLRSAECFQVDRVTRMLNISDKLLLRIEKVVSDESLDLPPNTIESFCKSLKNLKELQRTDREDENLRIDIVFGDEVGEWAK